VPRIEPLVDDPPEVAVALVPHVLQHPQRDEDVARAFEVAEVVLHVADPIGEPLLLRARLRVADLLARDVAGDDVRPVLERHVAGESAPPAARLQHAVAGPELQLAADVVVLRTLRLVEAQARGLEVGAGVDHALVEPEPVEFVAQVVVVLRAAARLLQVAGSHAPAARLSRAVLPALEDRLEPPHEASPDLHVARAVRVAEEARGIEGETQQRARAPHGDGRARRLRGEGVGGPVPQLESQRHLAEPCAEPLDELRHHAVHAQPGPLGPSVRLRGNVGNGRGRHAMRGHGGVPLLRVPAFPAVECKRCATPTRRARHAETGVLWTSRARGLRAWVRPSEGSCSAGEWWERDTRRRLPPRRSAARIPSRGGPPSRPRPPATSPRSAASSDGAGT
jgi:hypothetical protein